MLVLDETSPAKFYQMSGNRMTREFAVLHVRNGLQIKKISFNVSRVVTSCILQINVHGYQKML